MRTDRILLAASTALAIGMAASGSRAATEIQWWHAMGGELGQKVNEIAEGFNASQTDYTVVPLRRSW
jgi:sn-glycerol 3-phosphate transport system substrate-binding protein